MQVENKKIKNIFLVIFLCLILVLSIEISKAACDPEETEEDSQDTDADAGSGSGEGEGNLPTQSPATGGGGSTTPSTTNNPSDNDDNTHYRWTQGHQYQGCPGSENYVEPGWYVGQNPPTPEATPVTSEYRNPETGEGYTPEELNSLLDSSTTPSTTNNPNGGEPNSDQDETEVNQESSPETSEDCYCPTIFSSFNCRDGYEKQDKKCGLLFARWCCKGESTGQDSNTDESEAQGGEEENKEVPCNRDSVSLEDQKKYDLFVCYESRTCSRYTELSQYTCENENEKCYGYVRPDETYNPSNEPQTQETYKMCSDDKCVVMQGEGEDECNEDEDCVPTNIINCVKEGEKGSMFDGDPNNDVCCEGLVKVRDSYPYNTGCATSRSGFICTNCGDGKCGLSENVCNCPEDCEGQEEYTCTDSDGGKNYYVNGTVKGKADEDYEDKYDVETREFVDLCSGSAYISESEHYGLLFEGYCDENGIVQVENYYCPNGCEDGACVCEVKDTLAEAESKTYTVEGTDYDVEAVVIADSEPAKVMFSINEYNTDSMEEGNIFKLPDGAEIAVINIFLNEAEDITPDLVEFCLNGKTEDLGETETTRVKGEYIIINEKFPDDNYVSNIAFYTGVLPVGKIVRSLINFDLSGVENVDIKKAELVVNSVPLEEEAEYDNQKVNLHKVMQSWSFNTVTWNNKPNYDANAAASITVSENKEYTFEITNIMDYLIEHNAGVLLKAEDEEEVSLKRFDEAYLNIWYDPKGGQVQQEEDLSCEDMGGNCRYLFGCKSYETEIDCDCPFWGKCCMPLTVIPISGCNPEGESGCNPEEDDEENPQITEQECSIDNPCPEGLECFSFPEMGLRCAEENPCNYYECPEGTECLVEETYPASVICSCVGPECPTTSNDEQTTEENNGEDDEEVISCELNEDCAGIACPQVVGEDTPLCDPETNECYCGSGQTTLSASVI
jgi:hypothetical protein